MSVSTFETGADGLDLAPSGYVLHVLALVTVWGAGDALSTLVAFAGTGQVGLEANPLVRMLLAHDPLFVLVMKAAVGIVVGTALLSCREVVEAVPLWRSWMVGVTAVGAAIVVSNVYVGLAALA